MRVLVIGSGAREHAFVARLVAERGVAEVVAAPGNPGMVRLARTADVPLSDVDGLVAVARAVRADLTIVGPEWPLSLGVVDRFTAEKLPVVGPTRAAAALESSKAFAKAFMERHSVPTARFRTCDTEDEALATVHSGGFGYPLVVKADGLAAGKGVVIARDRQQAEEAVIAAMREQRFGAAGARLVLEEHLTGPEVSFFALSDGERALPIGTAQDHKRLEDDDRGPNTGGMGAFAPSPLVDEVMHARIVDDIVNPVIRGMAAEGTPFRGFLYAGLMLTPDGPKVIEFNVRFGDPEAQVVLPLIETPIVPLLVAVAKGDLRDAVCRRSSARAVGVVLASRGYPESSEHGAIIHGIDQAEALDGVSVLQAGTARAGANLVTHGGRVLTVVGRGATFEAAIARAYAGVKCISFEGMQFRRDIGRKAL